MFTEKFNKSFLIFIAIIVFTGSFIGCSPSVGTNESTSPKTTILTKEELDYFNGDEFFNGEYMNIRNQFLGSIYEKPEKIDLFNLFYCGSGVEEMFATEAERLAIIAYNEWEMEPDCGCEKISRDNMEAVLMKYTGLTLADTEKVGLDNFTYLEEYDAYYLYHGDTNYRMKIAFATGERTGDMIRLFYDDEFKGDGEKILTLQEKDGSYLFVSNVDNYGQ